MILGFKSKAFISNQSAFYNLGGQRNAFVTASEESELVISKDVLIQNAIGLEGVVMSLNTMKKIEISDLQIEGSSSTDFQIFQSSAIFRNV